jgi:tRNA (cmo5U34)-methyltransferase
MANRPSRKIDRLYAKQLKNVPDFKFDRNVAAAFDDMIIRSVPLYDELQRMMVDLAARFVQKRSNVYDLGCATGTTLCLMSKAIADPTVRFYGLDSSLEMLERAKRKVARLRDTRITLARQDLNSPLTLEQPSVIVMALTLQFINRRQRQTLITSLHDSLRPNGCLILCEKVVGADATLNRLMSNLYVDFKRRNRYSELEIAQKREALETVLVPYRLDENIRLLHEGGFATVEIFFKWYTFAGLIAVKARP